MKRILLYLTIAAASFSLSCAIQSQRLKKTNKEAASIQVELTIPTEKPNQALSILNESEAHTVSPIIISSEMFEILMNESFLEDRKSSLIDVFDEWADNDLDEAINWLESHQISIAKYPSIFESIASRVGSLEKLNEIGDRFLLRYQPQIYGAYLSLSDKSERLLTCEKILPYLNTRFKSSSLFELGKHLGQTELESLRQRDELSSNELSYLAAGIASQLPSSGPNNRFDWILSLEENEYNKAISMNLALTDTLQGSDVKPAIEILNQLLNSKPELANELIAQNLRKIRTIEPIESLDLLSMNGSTIQFQMALRDAYSLDPESTKAWLANPDNREIAELAISPVAMTEARDKGISSFDLLNYTTPNDIDKITGVIIYNLDLSKHSENEIRNRIQNIEILNESQKAKAIDHVNFRYSSYSN